MISRRINFLLVLAVALGTAFDSVAADFASLLVCERNGETDTGAAAGSVVAFFERSEEELAACDSGSPPDFCAAVDEIEVGMPCAKALAAVYRSNPEEVQTQAVQGGRPLILVAEELEGEAIATQIPTRPHTDVVFTFGEDDSVLVGCDFYSRQSGTLVVFDQRADGEAAIAGIEAGQSCAERFTLLLNDGTPLRSSASVSPGAYHAVPGLSDLGPDASEQGRAFDAEFSIQTARRFASPYYIMTVTHRF